MNHDKPPRGRMSGDAVAASGPTRSPWLRILGVSAAAAAAALVLSGIAASAVAGPAAALSDAFGTALVVAFFGISLLVGHVMGRRNPSGAIGILAVAYVIKVVGFAAVLLLVGVPPWLSRTWFFVGAVLTVVVWQAAEVITFSRTRLQIFNDPQPAPEPDDA